MQAVVAKCTSVMVCGGGGGGGGVNAPNLNCVYGFETGFAFDFALKVCYAFMCVVSVLQEESEVCFEHRKTVRVRVIVSVSVFVTGTPTSTLLCYCQYLCGICCLVHL